jgi:hypothetical protein
MREIKYNAYIPDLEIILNDITLYGGGMMGIDEDEFKESLPKNVRLDYDSDSYGYTDVIRDLPDTDEEYETAMKVLQGEDWIWIEKGRFIPLQLTCLSDMNGKLLYEKDIIKFSYFDNVTKQNEYIYGVIEFENGSFVVKEPKYEYTKKNMPETLFKWLSDEKCEFVGNSIVNPELIQFNN